MEITAEKRVGRRILNFIRAIAFPRFVGSAGERNAQTVIRKALHGAGYNVNDLSFTSSLFPLEFFPRLVVAVLCTVTIGAYLSLAAAPAIAVELAVLAGLLLIAATRWNRTMEWMYTLKRFGRLTSKNILAIHPHRENYMNLVFTAHYDSKSQTHSAVTRVALSCLLACCIVATNALTVLSAAYDLNPFYVLCALIPMSILGLILQTNATHSRSPGAYDNASGVAVLLELARSNAADTPPVNLGFVATGAEEAGLCGAVALMRDGRFIEMFPPARTVIINLDGIGSDGPLTITDRYGIPPVRTGPLVADLCIAIAQRFGIESRHNWLAMGAGMDHVPFASHGYQTVTLSTASFDKAFRAMHTKHDTADHLSIQSLERCYAVCQEIIDSIPATPYTLKQTLS